MVVNAQEVADVISDQLDLERWAVLNTTKLLLDDNTIPFIARYRKEKTNNMPVDSLREIKACLDDFKTLKARVESVTKSIEKTGKMTTEIHRSLHATRNINEVEHLYAPFKTGSKRTLAERARELGLEPLALQVMQGQKKVSLESAVKSGVEGLSGFAEVRKGVVHIIADVIAKDKEALDEIRILCRKANVTLESSKARSATKTEKAGKAPSKKTSKAGKPDRKVDADKFENYFQYTIPLTRIKPHQVLAINRGEALKVLSVKVSIPEHVKSRFLDHCLRRWPGPRGNDQSRLLVREAVEDGYKRLLEPLMVRQFRSELNKSAEKASVEVFGRNLKRLLLTPPVKGKVILGLDPGFRTGCKYAVTSATGSILDTGIVNLHCGGNKSAEMDHLKRIIHRFGCETVAIGNGTACRETETVMSTMIKSNAFKPLKVMYCIVSESGASIYSASDAAQKELPDMDVSLRGAVSIARRLQDPLSELVKIEPKHIGVGMYQHDVSESQLQTSLDGVVEECVSFVGVDVNVAGETLLRRVAGLNSTRAKKIIEWRESQGCIRNRQQLLAIKGLGPKSYEQCAGFIRIMPESMGRSGECVEAEDLPVKAQGRKRKLGATSKAGSKKTKLEVPDTCNPLDMTCIHPESYDTADKFLRLFDGNSCDIGKPALIQQVKQFVSRKGVSCLAADLAVPEPTLQLIVDGLSQPVGHDIREEFEKPLFKQGVSSLSDLKRGEMLTGRVTNTTHFGAFVDAGVGRDGLLHSSRITPKLLNGRKALELGDRVEVIVENVDIHKGRLGLKLHRLC